MEVRLHDANGMHIGSIDADDEPAHDGVVESGGKVYIWNQRNNQWRESSGSFKSKFEKLEVEAPPKGESSAGATEARSNR